MFHKKCLTKKYIYCLLSVILTAALTLGWAVQTGRAASPIFVRPDGSDTTCNGTVDAAATGAPNCAFATIQKAIDSAAGGENVNITAGTYNETLSITKSLTLQGAGEANTLIVPQNTANYGIFTQAENIVLKDFTLQGPKMTYGLKIDGKDTLTKYGGIIVDHVTVTNAGRTGINLDGISSGTISNVTSTGSTNGVGVALSDSSNVTVSGVTTSGNAWGGMAVYTKGQYFPGGSDGITLSGTNSFSETPKLYVQTDNAADPAHPFAVTNFTAGDFGYVVGNTDLPTYLFYYASETEAAAAVAATPAPYSASKSFIKKLNGGKLEGATFVVNCPLLSLQTAINAASSGDTINIGAGTCTENINVNKHVKLIGAGNTSTIIKKAITVSIIQITASGVSAADPILFKDLQVYPEGVNGFDVPSGSVSYVKLENVTVSGQLPRTIENENGFKVSTIASLAYLEIVDSVFENLDYGWYFAKVFTAADSSMVSNVTVINTEFNNNDYKGIYVEKLSDTTFTDVKVQNNGGSPFWNNDWNGGFDINLKNGTYQNLTFNNLTVTGNGLGYKEGAGLLIKARDDATSYNTFPATLTNVTINGGTFTGNERGIRFGEPGKNNASPTNVTIHNATIMGNVQTYSGTNGSAYGGLINMTQASINATGNYWGTTDAAGVAAQVYGKVDDHTWCDATFAICTYTMPVHNVTQDTYFGKIQPAIDASANGDTIEVAAGNYVENLDVNKSIMLLGPNDGVNPNTGSRSAEAVLIPATSDPDPLSAGAVTAVYVSASNVTIDGFTIDGDNPALTGKLSGTAIDMNGANPDAAGGIAGYDTVGNIKIENNIVKNVNYAGVDFENYAPSRGVVTTNNYIRYNKFDNIIPTQWGIGVIIYDNFYADITDNVMTRVRVGVQTGNFHRADTGTTRNISRNTIESQRKGIFYNLHYSDASPFTIANNALTALAGATNNWGISITSQQGAATVIVENNNVSGAKMGINLWNDPATTPITIKGGTILNCGYGIEADNYEGYASNGDAVNAILDGVTIQNSTIADVYVHDDILNTNASKVAVTVKGNSSLSSASSGIIVEGKDASIGFDGAAPTAFSGQTDYIILKTNGSDVPASAIDATAVSFAGKVSSAMSDAEAFNVENKITHKLDDVALGLVTFKANHFYVGNVGTNTSIQRAIDLAVSGDSVHVATGTNTETITINKNLKLLGSGLASSIIKAPATLPAASGQDSSIVIIKGTGVSAELSGFTVSGPGPTGCGSIGRGILVSEGAFANIHDNKILDIRDEPFSGCQNGIGIQVGRQAWSTTGTATIANNIVIGAQKGGIVVDNTGSNATLTGNTVTGVGVTTTTAQNGIQISRGATATLTGNTVSGFSYSKADAWQWGAAGILLYQNGAVTFSGGNNLKENDQILTLSESTGAVTLGAEIFGHSSAPLGYGSFISNDTNQNLDGSLSTYNGVNPVTASLAELFAIEDWLYDRVNKDSTGTGFITLKTGNVYVTVNGGSIQHGIDAALAGDTVHVSAGKFNERITINKKLTLLGATNGVDKFNYTIPTDYAWNTSVETIINSPDPQPTADIQVVDIGADDVTFDGFVVQSLNAPAGSANDQLLRINAQSKFLNNIKVINNLIGPNTNITSQTGTSGRMGLYLAVPAYSSSGVTNSTFANNAIFDTKGNGNTVFIWGSAKGYHPTNRADFTGTVIEHNNIFGSHRSGIEIAGAVDNLTIRLNKIHDNTGLPTDVATNLKYGNGILVVRMGADKADAAGLGAVNLTIVSNDIYNNQKNGIYLGPVNQGHLIKNNFFRDNGQSGIQVDLTEAYYGGYPVYNKVSNITTNENSFTATNGVKVVGIPDPAIGFVLDAKNNWWNHASGPAHTSNPLGTGAPVSDYNSFYPWLCTNEDVSTDFGFQPKLSPLCTLPQKLVFKTQPLGATLGLDLNPVALGQQPVVEVQDNTGLLAANFNGDIAMAFGTNPSGATLGGTTTITAVNGVATYNGLTVDKAVTGYTLNSSSSALISATSDTFTINNPKATLSILSPDSAMAGSQQSFFLTISGSGFVNGAQVKWDGTPRTTFYNTSQELAVIVWPSDLIAAKTVNITVENPTPFAGASDPSIFTVYRGFTLDVTTTGGGKITKSPDKTIYREGDIVILTAVPDSGWDFSVWSGDATGGVNPKTITMDGNKTVNAEFIQNGYAVNINKVGNGTVSMTPEKAVYLYGEQVLLTVTPDFDWNFSGWSGSGLSGNKTQELITIDGAITITATFIQVIHTGTYNISGTITVFGGSGLAGVTVSDGTRSATTAAGGIYTIKDVPNGTYIVTPTLAGYTFIPATHSVIVADGDQTGKDFTASAVCYDLTKVSNPLAGGSLSTSPDHSAACVDGKYIVGEVITLSQVTNTGYTFNSFSGTGVAGNQLTMPASNVTVTANFNKLADPVCYTLTKVASPSAGGTVIASPAKSTACADTGKYVEGEVITMSVTPRTYYHLDRWSTNVNKNTSKLTMPALDTTVTAYLENFLKAGTYNENNTSILYSTRPYQWNILTSSRYYASTQKYTTVKGARATFYIKGTRVGLLYTAAPNSGKMYIYIDNRPAIVLDEYSRTTSYQKRWWSSVIPNGTHKVVVVYSYANPNNRYGYIDGVLVQ